VDNFPERGRGSRRCAPWTSWSPRGSLLFFAPRQTSSPTSKPSRSRDGLLPEVADQRSPLATPPPARLRRTPRPAVRRSADLERLGVLLPRRRGRVPQCGSAARIEGVRRRRRAHLGPCRSTAASPAQVSGFTAPHGWTPLVLSSRPLACRGRGSNGRWSTWRTTRPGWTTPSRSSRPAYSNGSRLGRGWLTNSPAGRACIAVPRWSTCAPTWRARSHSVIEVEAAQLLRRYRLPPPDRQSPLTLPDGLARVDCYWDRFRVVAELDGRCIWTCASGLTTCTGRTSSG
jgi:hypothetical protein